MKKLLFALSVILFIAVTAGCASRAAEQQETQYQPGLPETLSGEVDFCETCL